VVIETSFWLPRDDLVISLMAGVVTGKQSEFRMMNMF
jgi:hypothetical protein